MPVSYTHLDVYKRQGVLSASDLLSLAKILKQARLLIDWKHQCDVPTPSLEGYFESLAPHRMIEEKITDAILSESEINDSASDELYHIRKKIKNLQGKVRDQLDHIVPVSYTHLPVLDLQKIQNEVTIELGNVSWLTINNLGSCISVELKENTTGKEISSDAPTNIVATKPGYIQRIEVYSGQKVVSPGDVVAKGDLLVSGIRDIPEKEHGIYEHSEAKIFAQTVTNETFLCPKQKD